MSAWQGEAEGAPLVFRGTPGGLTAAVSDPELSARRFPVRLALESNESWRGKAPVAARAFRVDGDMVLQMSLPARTPPGRYEGTIDVEGTERAVVIEVEPEVELQLVPDQLTLHGAPGERLTTELTLANAGNVAVEIRRAHAVGLFAVGGVERALHRVYMDEARGRPDDAKERSAPDERPAERPVDRLFAHFADEHGGLLRVSVDEGAGEIAPGETRALRVTFAVPERLTRGRTYTGTWPLHDLRYYIRLVVSDDPRSARDEVGA